MIREIGFCGDRYVSVKYPDGSKHAGSSFLRRIITKEKADSALIDRVSKVLDSDSSVDSATFNRSSIHAKLSTGERVMLTPKKGLGIYRYDSVNAGILPKNTASWIIPWEITALSDVLGTKMAELTPKMVKIASSSILGV